MQWQDYRKFMGIAAYTMLVLAGFLFCKATLAANQPIRLLVPPLDSPTQVYTRFKPLADYLSRKSGQRVQLVLSRNLDDFNSKVREPIPQLTYFCPLNYITVSQQRPYTPLAGLMAANGKNRSVVLVRKDSPIHRVADLKGRSLALGNTACAASFLIPVAMLQHEGINLGDFLEVRKAGSDQAALMAVAAKMYDVTATSEDTALPFIRKGILRILLYSRNSPPDLIAANALVPPSLQQQFKRALLADPPSKGSPAVGPDDGIGEYGFVPVADSQYNVIREMKRRFGDAPL